MNSTTGNRTLFVVALVGSLVLVNVLGLRLFGRLDLTKEKAYTLSKATKDTLTALEEPVVVTAYFTEQLPAPYSSNARYVRDLLEEFRAVSKGKVAFEFVDPQSQETDADKEAKKEVKTDGKKAKRVNTKAPVRLWVKGKFLGFKRSKVQQNTNQCLVQVAGVI